MGSHRDLHVLTHSFPTRRASDLHQPLDLLGVNYYSTVTVRMWDGRSPRQNADGHQDMGGSAWPGSTDVEFLTQPGPYTDMGWNIAPDGLEELLVRSEEHTSELQSLMRISYAVFCLKKKHN